MSSAGEGSQLRIAHRAIRTLVERMHNNHVSHNDLHTEQNVVVEVSGRPRLIDFQLASVHPGRPGRRRRRMRQRLTG